MSHRHWQRGPTPTSSSARLCAWCTATRRRRDVHELARTGTTAKERALLAVLSLLGARGERHSAPAFAAEAFAKVCGCFVEADETVLFRLWKVLDGPPR